jgi:ubiquinone/menaquinone biosynthesis C-methylase UbiE
MAPIASRVIAHAGLSVGEQVLDVGAGTGIIIELAAPIVGPGGHVTGIDISPEMLSYARKQLADQGLTNVTLREGGAEAIRADDESFDVVLASLSFMFVVDRAAAARSSIGPSSTYHLALIVDSRRSSKVRTRDFMRRFMARW